MGLKTAPDSETALRSARRERVFRWIALGSAVWAFATILLGADVTFSGAALSCPTWPGCVVNSSLAVIEVTHRGAALLLSLLILVQFVVAVLARREVLPGLRSLTAGAFLLVVAQALVGGAVILTQASPQIVVLHLGLAVALFGVLVMIALIANLPHLPQRWRTALLGHTTPSGPSAESLEGRPGPRGGTPGRGVEGEMPGPAPAMRPRG